MPGADNEEHMNKFAGIWQIGANNILPRLGDISQGNLNLTNSDSYPQHTLTIKDCSNMAIAYSLVINVIHIIHSPFSISL